jgi:aminopeptidase N
MLLPGAAPGALAQRPGVDIVSYRYRVILPDTGAEVQVASEIAFRRGDHAGDTLALDLVGMRVDFVGYRPAVRRGEPEPGFSEAEESYDGRLLRIPLAGRKGGLERVRVMVSGTPQDGLIGGTDSRGRRSFFADHWPQRARDWLPCVDQPGDKAEVTWIVTAPSAWRVVANGRLVSRVAAPGGRTTWTWTESHPIPTYTMVIGATRMAVSRHRPLVNGRDTIPIEVWTYPEDSAFADSVPFRRATEIVETLQRLVGPFPYETLKHVESATRYGGMENATAIFYDQRMFARRRIGEGVVRHETAHQWFGDAVTPRDWSHLWLSEGFASYFDLVVGQALDSGEVLAGGMRRSAEAYMRSPVTDRPVLDTAGADPQRLLDENSYQKGAWVLHMLRALVGDSAFFRGIREYYRAWRDSSATSDDFALVMARAAGTDLGWFFAQWLRQGGYPQLDVRWEPDSTRGRVTLHVRQTQPASWGAFRLPGLVVQLRAGGAAVDRYTIDVAAGRAEQSFTLRALAPPVEVIVDPGRAALLTAEVHR